MNSKILTALLAIVLLAQGAFAHTYLSAVYLNNNLLNEGDCMRAHPTVAFDSPISSLSSKDMTCGFLPAASSPANRKCPIAAGSSIGLQWHHSSNSPSDDIVDPSHVGPIIFYLAKSDSGEGNVWFKIYEDGFANGKWAVNRLIANKGRVDITIPSDIAPGNYLLRGELLALHNGYELNGVQPYVGCVELTISGNGNANPTGVAIPGAYKPTDPGMNFNVYTSFTSYPIPGPAVYKSGSAPVTSGSSQTPAPQNTPKPATQAPQNPAPQNTPKPATPAPQNPSTPAPQNTPNPASGSIQVQMYPGSSAWWVGVTVLGGSETTVKVEVMDSGSLSNYVALSDQSYAFVYGANKALVAPLSLRLTSSNGKQIILSNVFSSFTSLSLVSTNVNYGSSPSTPNTPKPNPSTPAPPSNGNVQFTVQSGANPWWFALVLNGASGATVEIMDSGSVSSFVQMKNEGWAYTLTTQGTPLVAPLSIRISQNGKISTSTLATVSPNQVVSVNGL